MNESPDLIIPPHGIPDDVVRIGVPKGASQRHITVEKAGRVRFLIDYQGEADFLLHLNIRSGAYVDVFHVYPRDMGKVISKSVYGLQEHASLNVWTFAAGNNAVIEHRAEFLNPHAFASFYGLSLLAGKSNVVHRVEAVHKAANCVSRQLYKSIVAAEAKSEFDSLVEVVRNAQKSDSRQLNKNLLLSKTAQAISRPELRIDADDVACAHGSATGQLNQEEIFYARTRGINEHEARFLMIQGFVGEILEPLPEIPLKSELSAHAKSYLYELAAA